jgi:hypothetical protein
MSADTSCWERPSRTNPAPSPCRGSNWRRSVFLPARKQAGISDRFRIHDLRHTAAALSKMSRIASDASFRSLRERALPAAQRATLRCPRPGGPPRGCGDLGLHGPPGSDATMMQLIPLRGLHHHCACWHRNASEGSPLHRLHHRQTQRAAPGRHRSCEGTRRTSASLVASRARPGHQPLSLHLMHPTPGDGSPRGRQLARQLRGTPTGRHAADVAATHHSPPAGERSWPGPATRQGRSAPVITNPGNSLRVPTPAGVFSVVGTMLSTSWQATRPGCCKRSSGMPASRPPSICTGTYTQVTWTSARIASMKPPWTLRIRPN